MNTTNYEKQIGAYLERIVRAIRRIENEAAVAAGLNPLQLRILQFLAIARHPPTVGFVADELEVSEPTISDSLRALAAKKLIEKVPDTNDRRVKYLKLRPAGRATARRMKRLIRLPLKRLDPLVLPRLSADLHQLVAGMFEMSLLHHARICMTCSYFSQSPGQKLPACRLLRKKLSPSELQSDCPDHLYRDAGSPYTGTFL
ncbi:MAG: MarR family transcriptional regulator [Spirochaetales bacterium]|nr:MarR family transcriptional regulator [Spirochaetales bacterium]